jgi:hypothetical protein
LVLAEPGIELGGRSLKGGACFKGGDEGAGVGDERIAFREMHGLSKKRDSETRSEVL